MDIKEANKLIDHVSKVIDYQVTKRGLLESQLFPVTAYVSLSFYNSYDILYSILKKVAEKTTPEKIGKESRKILSEIHALSIFYIPLYYMSGRMGDLVVAGEDPQNESPEKREQTRFILDFWQRLATSYFPDEKLTVYDSNFQNLALNQPEIDWAAESINSISVEEAKIVKKSLANVEMVAFMDECEARAKLCDHGPYRINDDEILVFREIMHLYDGKKPHFPWSATEAKAPHDNIAVVYRLKDVEAKFDDFATMTTDPESFTEKITGIALLTRDGDNIREVDIDKMPDFNDYAEKANTELFLRYSEWDRKKRLLAGAYAYSYGYARFSNHVGITDQLSFDITPRMMEQQVPYFMESDFDPGALRFFREDEEKEGNPSLFFIAEDE